MENKNRLAQMSQAALIDIIEQLSTRIKLLEGEIQQLKLENKQLKLENQELKDSLAHSKKYRPSQK